MTAHGWRGGARRSRVPAEPAVPGGPGGSSPRAGTAGSSPRASTAGSSPGASPARLRGTDLARLALVGLRTRKLRAALSALGIAIGVAAIVAVLGLSSSSAAGLNAEIAALGTNLLTVQPGNSFSGAPEELSPAAPAMISRLPGVYAVQTTGTIDGASAYRSPLIPTVNTNALTVDATSLGLPAAAGTSLAQGKFLNAATAREPVCVLGAAAAQLLGIDRVFPGERIWTGNMWLYVAGILKPDVLSPDVDASVLVGYPFAERSYGFDGHPTTIYVKAADSRVTTVDSLLGAQADPEDPAGPDVSVPSSALVAQADAKGAFNTLFLGLGAVALLVGAIGVANIMVIAVLERRSEIGLRRALGATRGHIRIQFLSEAVALALVGGAVGVAAGAAATALYAHTKGWATVIPAQAWAGGLAAALIIGALAGLLPALKAARLSPTEALWTL
jgi:putative ABC transport system permease protein